MYAVCEPSLRELTAGYNSVHLVFFGIFFGAAIAFGIAWGQVPKTDQMARFYYFSSALCTLLVSLFFGVAGGVSLWKAHKEKDKLYSGSQPIEMP
jgi:hypothetical protein